MHNGAWALRAVEAAYMAALVAVTVAVANSGICTQACHDFASWWAEQTRGTFAIQIYEVTVEAPRLSRGDLPLAPDAVAAIIAADALAADALSVGTPVTDAPITAP